MCQDALLVIDLQNDFLPGGALAVPGGDRVIDPIRGLMTLPNWRAVVLTQDWHPADHVSFASSHPGTGKMADTVEEQAAQSLANLKAILAEAGLSMANVVKTVIFLADINDFAAVNAVYAKAFAEPFPARSCVQVAAIPKGAKLEIECIAVRE